MKSPLTFILLVLSLQLSAQLDTTDVQLTAALVVGKRLSMPVSEQARSVIVVNQQQLKTLPSQSVAGALQFVAGIDIRQRGPNGVQADAGIRGSTFDQVLILVNGIKISDLQTGHHSLNLPLDIENIERIEILKGPGARVYGQNAFAGAINIVTKSPDQPYLKIQGSFGQHALWGGKLSGAFATGPVNHYLSVAHDQSDGYKFNTDYSITNYFYQNEINLGANQIQVLGGFTDRQFGANGFYASPEFIDQYEEIQTSLAAINWKRFINDDILIKSSLYWRRNKDDYVFIRNNPAVYQNIHTSQNYGGEVNLSIESGLGITGLGLDINQLQLESTNLGTHDRTVVSFFAEQRFNWLNGHLNATPGIQFNYYSDFGVNLLPGIDVGFKINKQVGLFANWGRTYRVPTFTDLYYVDPANNGNSELEPEYANTYEIGLKWQAMTGLTGQISYFQRNGKDIIDWAKSSPDDKWTPDNLIGVETKGFDGNITYQNGNPQSIFHQFDLGFTYLDATTVDVETQLSRYALEHLRHQYSAGITLKYGDLLTHSIYYRYYNRLNLEDYHLVDSRLNVQWNQLSVFVEASNLFDTFYRETNLVEMPGRWVKSGIGYTFQ